jgi:hypothetical protein
MITTFNFIHNEAEKNFLVHAAVKASKAATGKVTD